MPASTAIARRLVVGGRTLADVGEATTAAARRRGLLGRDAVVGALVLTPARSVHTFGMRFPIDVAHIDRHGRVLRTTTMAPNRLGAVVVRSRSVLEAESGSFVRWGLSVGDRIELR